MRVLAVIPSRYASTRLPGKPLCDIGGKPMVQHVYERARQATTLDTVLVATDDARIAGAVHAFGGEAVMTSPLCATGSDRLLEVARTHPADIYINIQGDEPLLDPAAVDALVRAMLHDPGLGVGSLCFPITGEQAADPATVKVVRAASGKALYFSRAPIPFPRNEAHAEYWGHCGIYAYRADALRLFGELPPSPLEQAESLEQLRLMQAGVSIGMVECRCFGPAVDTPEDLEAVRRIMDGNGGGCRNGVATASEAPADEISALLRRVRLVITDVDGVLTDGGLYYGPEGEALKRFHARDGLGIKLLQQAGIEVAVLSGRDCPALRARLKDLGITNFHLGQLAKEDACRAIMTTAGVRSEETIFVGDDVPDARVFGLCGCGVAVADAPDYVRRAAQWVLATPGGAGAFREAADALLRAQGVAFLAERPARSACVGDGSC